MQHLRVSLLSFAALLTLTREDGPTEELCGADVGHLMGVSADTANQSLSRLAARGFAIGRPVVVHGNRSRVYYRATDAGVQFAAETLGDLHRFYAHDGGPDYQRTPMNP